MTAYLDHAATSPLRPEALAAMLPYLSEHFGNPSGSHAVARRARAAVEEARESVAAVLAVEPGEVVFTSGGTESCNLAVLGAWRRRRGAVLCSALEHHAVLGACAATGSHCCVGARSDGTVDREDLAAKLHPGVALVSIMLANNETGVVQPLPTAISLVREQAREALVHSDVVAAHAWPAWLEDAAGADLLSLAAHKLGGPKGVGVLVVRGGVALAPVLHGGPQERERRPGTHDVAGIVGTAAALEAAACHGHEEHRRVTMLRRRLADGLATVPGATVTGHGAGTYPGGGSEPPAVVPGTCHVRFAGVDQEELLLLLDQEGVCASAGAACASGALEPSHVLVAMGLSTSEARSAVRFSLGWSSTERDVDEALDVVPKAVARLRRSA